MSSLIYLPMIYFFVSVGPRVVDEIRAQNALTDLDVRLTRVGAEFSTS